MKKFIFFGVVMILGACAPQTSSELKSDNHPVIRSLTSEEQCFINESILLVRENSANARDLVDVENLNNEFEYIGVYIQGMLRFISQDEILNPSNSKEEYLSKFTLYQENNPVSFDLNENLDLNSPLFSELQTLIKNSYTRDIDFNAAISELKSWEDIISETTLLDDLQKQSLIGFTTILKYVKATIFLEGVVVGDETLPAQSWCSWCDCFDRTFDTAAQDNLSVLTNTNSPVLMVGAWRGLPGTLAWGVGDAIYQGIAGC
jgi:hypothetical protein